MNSTSMGSVALRAIRIAASLAIAFWSGSAFGELVPVKLLLSYAPAEETCASSIRAEDRRHDIALLRFREQQRAVFEKYQEDMIDCQGGTANIDDCAIGASRTQQAGLNAILKKQAQEDKVHLNKLDEITTFCAQGKLPVRR
jgi:hypothetical protein